MDWFGFVLFCFVWFGLVWFGLVWFGLVWFGLVWFGLVWFGLVWFGWVGFTFALAPKPNLESFSCRGRASPTLKHRQAISVLERKPVAVVVAVVAVHTPF